MQFFPFSCRSIPASVCRSPASSPLSPLRRICIGLNLFPQKAATAPLRASPACKRLRPSATPTHSQQYPAENCWYASTGPTGRKARYKASAQTRQATPTCPPGPPTALVTPSLDFPTADPECPLTRHLKNPPRDALQCNAPKPEHGSNGESRSYEGPPHGQHNLPTATPRSSHNHHATGSIIR